MFINILHTNIGKQYGEKDRIGQKGPIDLLLPDGFFLESCTDKNGLAGLLARLPPSCLPMCLWRRTVA